MFDEIKSYVEKEASTEFYRKFNKKPTCAANEVLWMMISSVDGNDWNSTKNGAVNLQFSSSNNCKAWLPELKQVDRAPKSTAKERVLRYQRFPLRPVPFSICRSVSAPKSPGVCTFAAVLQRPTVDSTICCSKHYSMYDSNKAMSFTNDDLYPWVEHRGRRPTATKNVRLHSMNFMNLTKSMGSRCNLCHNTKNEASQRL